jgi:Ferritin-like
MDPRQLRLVSNQPAALRAPLASAAAGAFSLEQDPELTDVQYAIFLLQTAADVEHSLLVQYLYAAYSLKPDIPVGAKDPGTGKEVTTTTWAGTIAGIAQEEMGHLLSVQLLLRALGGPLSFAREHFPYRTQLYPFPFELEPLTKGVLAKYVYAEMPEIVAPEVLPPEERREIAERAAAETGGVGLNHVGVLYDTLLGVLQRLPDSAFRDGAADWQADPSDWGDANQKDSVVGIHVLPIRLSDCTKPAKTLREVALRAVRIIATQGEAPTAMTLAGRMGPLGLTAAEMGISHFRRFLEIYRQYCDDFFPTRDVARNPNTTMAPQVWPMDPEGLFREQRLQAGRITEPMTLLWAQLFNIRYRILLSYLAHYVALRAYGASAEEAAIRNRLSVWALEEMNGRRPPTDFPRNSSSIKALAIKLADLDRTACLGPKAGAPFEAPFTFALPDLGPERWRLHKELYLASQGLVRKIVAQSPDPALAELTRYEEGTAAKPGRIKFIEDHINSCY